MALLAGFWSRLSGGETRHATSAPRAIALPMLVLTVELMFLGTGATALTQFAIVRADGFAGFPRLCGVARQVFGPVRH
jgi:hypothetical protein